MNEKLEQKISIKECINVVIYGTLEMIKDSWEDYDTTLYKYVGETILEHLNDKYKLDLKSNEMMIPDTYGSYDDLQKEYE